MTAPNVVALRKPKRTAKEIADARLADRLALQRQFSASLQALTERQHRKVEACLAECAEVAHAMSVQDMYEWLAIGRELCGRTTGPGGEL